MCIVRLFYCYPFSASFHFTTFCDQVFSSVLVFLIILYVLFVNNKIFDRWSDKMINACNWISSEIFLHEKMSRHVRVWIIRYRILLGAKNYKTKKRKWQVWKRTISSNTFILCCYCFDMICDGGLDENCFLARVQISPLSGKVWGRTINFPHSPPLSVTRELFSRSLPRQLWK